LRERDLEVDVPGYQMELTSAMVVMAVGVVDDVLG
jgi:hypothetical protein